VKLGRGVENWMGLTQLPGSGRVDKGWRERGKRRKDARGRGARRIDVGVGGSGGQYSFVMSELQKGGYRGKQEEGRGLRGCWGINGGPILGREAVDLVAAKSEKK